MVIGCVAPAPRMAAAMSVVQARAESSSVSLKSQLGGSSVRSQARTAGSPAQRRASIAA